MNCVVLLEDCMGFVEGETGYCSDTCVTGGVGGTGEGIIQVECEVRLRGVHEMFPTHAVRPFIALRRKFKITLSCFLLYFVLKVPYILRNLDCSHDERHSGIHRH
jgi:hypothetical protein